MVSRANDDVDSYRYGRPVLIQNKKMRKRALQTSSTPFYLHHLLLPTAFGQSRMYPRILCPHGPAYCRYLPRHNLCCCDRRGKNSPGSRFLVSTFSLLRKCFTARAGRHATLVFPSVLLAAVVRSWLLITRAVSEACLTQEQQRNIYVPRI